MVYSKVNIINVKLMLFVVMFLFVNSMKKCVSV